VEPSIESKERIDALLRGDQAVQVGLTDRHRRREEQASRFERPASRRKIVLIPQMKDAASVFPSRSAT